MRAGIESADHPFDPELREEIIAIRRRFRHHGVEPATNPRVDHALIGPVPRRPKPHGTIDLAVLA